MAQFPPSYDDVVTDAQRDIFLQNELPFLTPSYGSFTNDSFQSTQQLDWLDVRTTEAPPAYIDAVEPQCDQQHANVVCSYHVTYKCISLLLFCVSAVIPITMIILGEYLRIILFTFHWIRYKVVFSKLISGVMNLGNCIGNSMIPIHLIVAGSLAVCGFLFYFLMKCVYEDDINFKPCCGIAMFVYFAVQCWGSLHVLSRWYDRNTGVFVCDKSTYLLSISTLIIYWILAYCRCLMTRYD